MLEPSHPLTCVCGCFCYPFLLSSLLLYCGVKLLLFYIYSSYFWLMQYVLDGIFQGTATNESTATKRTRRKKVLLCINLNALQYTHGLHIHACIYKSFLLFYYYIPVKVMKLDMVLMWRLMKFCRHLLNSRRRRVLCCMKGYNWIRCVLRSCIFGPCWLSTFQNPLIVINLILIHSLNRN